MISLKVKTAFFSQINLINHLNPLNPRCLSMKYHFGKIFSVNNCFEKPQNILSSSDFCVTLKRQQVPVRYTSGHFPKQIPVVSYEYVKKLVPSSSEQVLIDVREPSEIIENGKIPNSINIPLGSVAEALSCATTDAKFKKQFGASKPSFETEIIFHCHVGKRSHAAAEIAVSQGFKNAKNYEGSWKDWEARNTCN